ncbi:HAD family hydrolase [Spirochaeta cellobiosiphila]|uniref:HAD family hydrolase n=1 Tax=Spirochaeta cellobiosiphila TaxID=504483 RepID=UPI000429B421|nr:HAD family phosphatase [Spirochaeta cellobiosiphila]
MAHKQNSGIVFDLDGTLIDSERLALGIWINLCKEKGYLYQEKDFVQMIGKDSLSCKNILCVALSLKSDEVDNLWSEAVSRYQSLMQTEVRLKTGAMELISWAGTQGIPMAIATTTESMLANKIIENLNLNKWINSWICGDQVEKKKPFPDIYLKAAELLDIDPKFSYAIEDSRVGIKAAHSAGFNTIFVPDVLPASEDMKTYIGCSFGDLNEVLVRMKGVFSE